MGWNVRFWYGPNLLIRDEVLFNCAIAFNGSGRHERGVSPPQARTHFVLLFSTSEGSHQGNLS
jgi:hypothetical protein